MLKEVIKEGLFQNEDHLIVAADRLHLYELLGSKESEVERQGLLLRVRVVHNCKVLSCFKFNLHKKAVFVLTKRSLLQYVTFLLFLDDIECSIALFMLEVDPHHDFISLLKNKAEKTKRSLSVLRCVIIFVVMSSVIEDDELSSNSLHIAEAHIIFLVLFTTDDLFVLNEFLF